MKEPRVSVCIPVFNPGNFLEAAIESVLAQSFADFELLVVDDASTQPVANVVGRFDDPRIRFEENPSNLGLVGNWNRCLAFARGEYITIFHQDDLMTPDNLEAKIGLLDRYVSVGLVHSNIVLIDAAGDAIKEHWAKQPISGGVMPGNAFLTYMALRGNFVSCPSVVARSECYQVLGGFDPQLPFTCDMDMWMRIASRYDVGYLSEPLISNRVHVHQTTHKFSGSGKEMRETKRALDKAFSRYLPLQLATRELRRRAHRNLASWAFRNGRAALAGHQWKSGLGYLFTGMQVYISVLRSLSAWR